MPPCFPYAFGIGITFFIDVLLESHFSKEDVLKIVQTIQSKSRAPV